VIASGTGEAQSWRTVAGVTHVTPQTSYGSFGPPLWGFSALPLPQGGGPAAPAPAPAPAPAARPAAAPVPAPRAARRASKASRRTQALVSTDLARGHLGLWVPLLRGRAALSFRRAAGPGSTPALRLRVRGGQGAGYVALGAALPPRRTVTSRAELNIAGLRLAARRARALMTVGGDRGAGYQVGVARTRSGALRWAAWLALPKGRRSHLVISHAPVRLRQWVRLELRTTWGTRRGRAALLVDGKVVLRTRAQLAGVSAVRTSVGLGRASTKREAGLMFLRAARVLGR
jgi:hypothetical protein